MAVILVCDMATDCRILVSCRMHYMHQQTLEAVHTIQDNAGSHALALALSCIVAAARCIFGPRMLSMPL